MSELLTVKNLTHIYSAGTPFERVAIDDVSLTVAQGEFVALIGHTGSGKSTLIQHFNGLLRPTSGQVLLDGKDIFASATDTVAARYSVGLVFQYPEYQLFEETVYKDISFGPKNMKLSPEEIDRRVLLAAKQVGLDPDLMEKSPFELSGGEKRRAALAGVFAMQPRLLVLDEPMAGLDPVGREEILSCISNYRQETGAAVLFVTHSMEDAARAASRLIVMAGGRILLSGTPGEVFSQSEKLISSGLDIPTVTRIFLRLREQGFDLSPAVYTVEQAAEEIARFRREAGLC